MHCVLCKDYINTYNYQCSFPDGSDQKVDKKLLLNMHDLLESPFKSEKQTLKVSLRMTNVALTRWE